jgi:hypothetical protein
MEGVPKITNFLLLIFHRYKEERAKHLLKFKILDID